MSINNNTTISTSTTTINSSETLLNKVKQFLPKIAEANAKLKIEMVEDLVVIKSLDEESDTSSENSDETSNDDFSGSDDDSLPNTSNKKVKKIFF